MNDVNDANEWSEPADPVAGADGEPPAARRARRYAFVVAVLGAKNMVDAEHLSLLLQALVNRHRDDRDIWLVTAGPDSPELRPWAHDLGWTILYEPCGREPCRQDHAILALAHAVVVLGNPRPWERLLRLARESGIPTRVYERAPRRPVRPGA